MRDLYTAPDPVLRSFIVNSGRLSPETTPDVDKHDIEVGKIPRWSIF
jgi:hypothetical protein